MIVFPEPMPITDGSDGEQSMLFGIKEDTFGDLYGLVADSEGMIVVRQLHDPVVCDWRYDAAKDKWTELGSTPQEG